jgi:hypothetical protein
MNKKEFLKIAKVKTVDEFYQKFPDEASFMKAHGKEFKKAMRENKVDKAQVGTRTLPSGREMSQQLRTDFPLAKSPDIDAMMKPVNVPGSALKSKSAVGGAKGVGATSYIEPVMDVIQGASMIKGQKQAVRKARQNKELTGIQAQAAESVPIQPINRQYLRPEDVVYQPEQMFPSYGVGTNVLAENGAMIGGNPTEIQNTFAPNTIYSDMGYEPLSDSSKVKQFKAGGGLSSALNNGNFGQFMTGGGGDFLQTIGGAITGEPDAGSKIGGGIGQAAGMAIGGPVGGMIGKFAGSLIGDMVDTSEKKIRESNEQSAKNMGRIAASQAGVQFQDMFGLRNGGEVSDYQWVSHTWQPQLIAKFGEHKVSDLLRPPADADMLRAGGEIKNIRKNYISPEEEMLTNMALGGQLETTWGGYAEPISQNPYMPSTGQTVMFRGQSHDESDGKGRTGIGVKYGAPDSYTDYAEYGTNTDADVEVERNEPAVELPNGDGENSMVVYGNLKIPNQFLSEVGDPKAKGKKFKTYVKDLSKKEQRQNKIIDKSSEKIDELNPQSPFDMLKFNSLAANIKGANMKLKQYADFKTNAAAVQNAINDTAEEMGLDADTLAKGRVKIDKSAFQGEARYGKSVPKAQDGLKTDLGETITEDQLKELQDLYNKAKAKGTKSQATLDFQKKFHQYLPKAALKYNKETNRLTAKAKNLGVKKEDLAKIDPNNLSGDLEKRVLQGNEDEYFGPITTKYIEIAKASAKKPPTTGQQPSTFPIVPFVPKKKEDDTSDDFKFTEYKQNPYLEAIAAALPYLRPTDMEELDPRQIMGETYALSTNQVEPVQAQKLQPRLATPIDISLQDILNENRATLRRQQQMVGYNPAAQSAFAAQEYGMNQKVLGEQFRLNQAEKQRVYEKNRDILNQNDLTNLGIFDRQYERQATALSKTKATAQEALNSISSKIMQNRLENRTLATYENLYGYRFDPNFRAINYQTAGFNVPTVYAGPDGKYYKANQSTGQLEEIRTPNIGANFTMPSLATPPIVPAGTVTTVDGQQLTPITPSAPVTVPADRSPLISRPGLISDAAEEYEDLYRKGGSVKKNKKAKEARNSSIVRALKNI